MQTILAVFNSYVHVILCIWAVIVISSSELTVFESWFLQYLMIYTIGGAMVSIVLIIIVFYISCFCEKIAQCCCGYQISQQVLDGFRWFALIWGIFILTTLGCIRILIVLCFSIIPKFVTDGCKLWKIINILTQPNTTQNEKIITIHQLIIYIMTITITIFLMIILCHRNDTNTDLPTNVLLFSIIGVSSMTIFMTSKLDKYRYLSPHFQFIYMFMAIFISIMEILNVVFCVITHFYIPQTDLNVVFIYLWDIICILSIPYSLTIFYTFYFNQYILKLVDDSNTASLINWCIYDSLSIFSYKFINEEILDKMYCILSIQNDPNQSDSIQHLQYMLLTIKQKESILQTALENQQNKSSDNEALKREGIPFKIYLIAKIISMMVGPLWFIYIVFVYDIKHFNGLWIMQLLSTLYVLYFSYVLRKCARYLQFISCLKIYENEENNEYFEEIKILYVRMTKHYPVFECLLEADIMIEIATIIIQYIFESKGVAVNDENSMNTENITLQIESKETDSFDANDEEQSDQLDIA